jgi:Bacterial SH3 domain
VPVSLAIVALGAFALIVAARRRRRQPEAALATAGLDGPDIPAPLPAVVAAPPVDDPFNETHMPRWRRPSLKAARAADRAATSAVAWQLAFVDTAAPGTERRRIRYRLVRLSDAPDEIRSTEVAQLEKNDEVEVLERQASYVRVRTPAGQEGWVHRTTLGPALGMDDPDAPLDPPASEIEPEPA